MSHTYRKQIAEQDLSFLSHMTIFGKRIAYTQFHLSKEPPYEDGAKSYNLLHAWRFPVAITPSNFVSFNNFPRPRGRWTDRQAIDFGNNNAYVDNTSTKDVGFPSKLNKKL